MKQQFTLFSLAVLVMIAVSVSAFRQKGKEAKQGKGNQQKEQKDHGRGQDKQDKADKGNGKPVNDNGNDNKGKGNDHGKGNDDKARGKDKEDGRGNNDKNDNGNGNGNEDNGKGKGHKAITGKGYKWDDETFKNRNDIRKGQEKVTICHKFNRNDEPAVTIRVAAAALDAHLGHGDVRGECPAVTNNRFSNGFLQQRRDYYTLLNDSQEQVLYSRSILDYAIERLTGARAQLVTMQNSNVPAAELESRRLLVVDLENNVSLLQQILGVTATLVANRLMQ